MTRLGVNGFDPELGAWIDDPQLGQGGLRSDLIREVLRGIRAGRIEVSFPHRDVRVLDGCRAP